LLKGEAPILALGPEAHGDLLGLAVVLLPGLIPALPRHVPGCLHALAVGPHLALGLLVEWQSRSPGRVSSPSSCMGTASELAPGAEDVLAPRRGQLLGDLACSYQSFPLFCALLC